MDASLSCKLLPLNTPTFKLDNELKRKTPITKQLFANHITSQLDYQFLCSENIMVKHRIFFEEPTFIEDESFSMML